MYRYYPFCFLVPQMRWLFTRLQEIRWDGLLSSTTDFGLLEMRDDLCNWLMRWGNAKQYQDRLPNDYPRWDIDFQDIFRSLPLADQAIVLVGWLALHSDEE